MTDRAWSSPRGTAWMAFEGGAPVLRFESDEEWHELARRAQRRLATLDSPAALPMIGDSVSPDAGQGWRVLVLRFAPASPRAARRISPVRAASLAVDLAALVQAHREAGGTEVLGPHHPAFVVTTDAGERFVAPGFARLAEDHDAGIRGMRGGGRISHTRFTCDQLRGTPGAPHEVSCLALLVIELVAGREPYPLANEMEHMRAVRAGDHEPLDPLVPELSRSLRRMFERALRVEAAARPTLRELCEALLAEPGVAELRARAATTGDEAPRPAKPWWKLW